MMKMHQFEEYQMHETLTEANNDFMMKRSNDSGLGTVDEEDEDLQVNPSGGVCMPQKRMGVGSISNQGINNGSLNSNDIELEKEEERIRELYAVLNIERRQSVVKTKDDSLVIAKDYVRRASAIQDLATANNRRGSVIPSSFGDVLNSKEIVSENGRRGSVINNGQRRPSTIFMPPITNYDTELTVF